LWSFVDNKGNKQWVWLALDADTREIVGVDIGKRDEAAARRLWQSLPPVYRQCAVTFGPLMGQFYRANDIERWGKKQAKPVTSSDSTIP